MGLSRRGTTKSNLSSCVPLRKISNGSNPSKNIQKTIIARQKHNAPGGFVWSICFASVGNQHFLHTINRFPFSRWFSYMFRVKIWWCLQYNDDFSCVSQFCNNMVMFPWFPIVFLNNMLIFQCFSPYSKTSKPPENLDICLEMFQGPLPALTCRLLTCQVRHVGKKVCRD